MTLDIGVDMVIDIYDTSINHHGGKRNQKPFINLSSHSFRIFFVLKNSTKINQILIKLVHNLKSIL